MAYFSQEMKKEFAPRIKSILKEYGVNGTISVIDKCELVVNLTSGKLDIMTTIIEYLKNFNDQRTKLGYRLLADLDEYRQLDHHDITEIQEYKDKQVRAFLLKLIDAMNLGNHCTSDIIDGYSNVGWYACINVGKYKKPYIYEA